MRGGRPTCFKPRTNSSSSVVANATHARRLHGLHEQLVEHVSGHDVRVLAAHDGAECAAGGAVAMVVVARRTTTPARSARAARPRGPQQHRRRASPLA
jgi:hypothetical protein